MDIYLANIMRLAQLAHQLVQMAACEAGVREKSQTSNQLLPGDNLTLDAIRHHNAKQLREIIAEIGWPTLSKVGDKASEAAWLIVHHSIREPAFMRGCYTLMEIVSSDINPVNLAYLHARICYFTDFPSAMVLIMMVNAYIR